MVSIRGAPSLAGGNKKIGNATTYIQVDTINNTFKIVINGVQQDLWS